MKKKKKEKYKTLPFLNVLLFQNNSDENLEKTA